jgi:hypothetical protein
MPDESNTSDIAQSLCFGCPVKIGRIQLLYLLKKGGLGRN